MTMNERPGSEISVARSVVHAAAQIPAAVAHAFAPRQDDFSHTTLQYAPALGALVGESFGPAPVRLAVRFSDASVLVLGADDAVQATVATEGKTMDAVRARVLATLTVLQPSEP